MIGSVEELEQIVNTISYEEPEDKQT